MWFLLFIAPPSHIVILVGFISFYSSGNSAPLLYNCYRQPQLTVSAKVDVIVFAGIVAVVYLTAVLLVGHMVTFFHSFPILSSYSYHLQSHNRKGYVCTGFRMRRAESSVFHLKWLSPTYPLPSYSTLPSFGKQHEQSLWDASSLFSSFSQS